MTWKNLLQAEIEDTYCRTLGLLELVDDGALNWKPASGENWMNTGQLLHHLTNACGFCFKGFVTGDCGMPADFDPSTASHEDMLPPAERLPAVASVAEARKLVEEDKALALATLANASEADLETRPAPAPWDPSQVLLGQRLLQMVEHLKQHKGQLFYYLKLQGQPVNTMHLWV